MCSGKVCKSTILNIFEFLVSSSKSIIYALSFIFRMILYRLYFIGLSLLYIQVGKHSLCRKTIIELPNIKDLGTFVFISSDFIFYIGLLKSLLHFRFNITNFFSHALCSHISLASVKQADRVSCMLRNCLVHQSKG